MRLHLTELAVRSLRPSETQLKVWDTQTPNFGIRINGRTKSWIVVAAGKQKVLGRYPDMTLQTARQKAKELLLKPNGDERPRITISAAIDQFLDTYCEQNQRERTRRETRRILRKHLEPRIGTENAGTIKIQSLTAILDGLLPTPSEAAHAYRTFRVFFKWMAGRDYIERDPLEKVPTPSKDKQRDRVLTDEEIKKLWDACEGMHGDIWKLLLLTGQRRGQIGSLKWEWIQGDVIQFPAEIMKGGKAHILPIGEMAKQIIEANANNHPYVFPGRWDKSQPFNGWGKLKDAHNGRAGVKDYVTHDLRRTMRTIHGRIGTLPHLAERLVAHIGNQSEVEKIYDRWAYLPEMRMAVAAYENHIHRIIA